MLSEGCLRKIVEEFKEARFIRRGGVFAVQAHQSAALPIGSILVIL